MSITVACSGGYDPIHIGHIRQFQEAKKLGDRLVVILNGDSFLLRKKGFVFMPQAERAEIILSIGCVDEVFLFESDSDFVTDALAIVRPTIFAKGGDRNAAENTPEWQFCQANGIKVVFGVGGYEKVQSSQWLTKNMEGKKE